VCLPDTYIPTSITFSSENKKRRAVNQNNISNAMRLVLRQ